MTSCDSPAGIGASLRTHVTARWGQINYKKKVHPKFLQNLLFHIPIDMFYGKKTFSAIESATVIFFLKFFHKKLVETTVCGAILTPVMGFYGSWPMFQNVWRPQLCTKGNNIELLLVKIGPESNNKHFRSLEWLYVLMYQLWTVCGAISTPVMGF